MNSDLAFWIGGSIILFIIGLYGLATKKDGLKMIISIEIMVTAVNSIFIGIGFVSRDNVDPLAQTYALLSLAVGGVIIGVALSMLTSIYKTKGTVDMDTDILLRW